MCKFVSTKWQGRDKNRWGLCGCTIKSQGFLFYTGHPDAVDSLWLRSKLKILTQNPKESHVIIVICFEYNFEWEIDQVNAGHHDYVIGFSTTSSPQGWNISISNVFCLERWHVSFSKGLEGAAFSFKQKRRKLQWNLDSTWYAYNGTFSRTRLSFEIQSFSRKLGWQLFKIT